MIDYSMTYTIILNTKKYREIIDITDKVGELVKKENITGKVCNIFLPHTSASVILNEFAEGTEYNFEEVSKKILPKVSWNHRHNPAHAGDHILSSLFGQFVCIPITKGRLDLGPWQRILFVEFNGPRDRQVLVTTVS